MSSSARPRVNLSIDVPDLEDGLRFYGQVFGFTERARPFPSMAVLDANNLSICMHAKAGGSKSSPVGESPRHYDRHWTPVHMDVHVVDFDAALARVREHGGAIEMEFREQGPMPVAFCSDPFGNGFCVLGES